MSVTAITLVRLNHEDLFLERYDYLIKSALQLTDANRQSAEDLVHEAYIVFTQLRPDLTVINNLDNYLYVVMRNLHFSSVRRLAEQRTEQISHLEYDLIKSLVLIDDHQNRLQTESELRVACLYGCLRKESSLVGSVFILRFFHGYFPSEIAKLSKSSRNKVNVQIKFARSELQAFLANPGLVEVVNQRSGVRRSDFGKDVFAKARQRIFNTRRGECFKRETLFKIYQSTFSTVSRLMLNHLVSCPLCLDEANLILGLPLLQERHPVDVLDREAESK